MKEILFLCNYQFVQFNYYFRRRDYQVIINRIR